MKSISHIALLTILFSVSAPLFSEENLIAEEIKTKETTEKVETITQTTKTSTDYRAQLTGFPTAFAAAVLTAKIPNTISDYTFKYALDKVATIKYLKNSNFSKNTGTIGVLLVYTTALYLTYKLYKYATTESSIDEDIFECPELN